MIRIRFDPRDNRATAAAQTRAHEIYGRLAQILRAGVSPDQVIASTLAGQEVVLANGHLVATPDQTIARANESTRRSLALQWANNIRFALATTSLAKFRWWVLSGRAYVAQPPVVTTLLVVFFGTWIGYFANWLAKERESSLEIIRAANQRVWSFSENYYHQLATWAGLVGGALSVPGVPDRRRALMYLCGWWQYREKLFNGISTYFLTSRKAEENAVESDSNAARLTQETWRPFDNLSLVWLAHRLPNPPNINVLNDLIDRDPYIENAFRDFETLLNSMPERALEVGSHLNDFCNVMVQEMDKSLDAWYREMEKS